MIKVRRLFVLAIGMPLLAVSGCGPKHMPVSVSVLVPPDATQEHIESSSVLAEKGATLTFEATPESPSETTLEIQFLRNGVAARVCSEGTTLTGPSPLTCHPMVTGDFDIAIFENQPGKRRLPKPQIKAYIRPCKGCTT